MFTKCDVAFMYNISFKTVICNMFFVVFIWFPISFWEYHAA